MYNGFSRCNESRLSALCPLFPTNFTTFTKIKLIGTIQNQTLTTCFYLPLFNSSILISLFWFRTWKNL